MLLSNVGVELSVAGLTKPRSVSWCRPFNDDLCRVVIVVCMRAKRGSVQESAKKKVRENARTLCFLPSLSLRSVLRRWWGEMVWEGEL